MPWNAFANWTDEDRHAVLTYLRQVMPVNHSIPDPVRDATLPDPEAMDLFFGRDFGSGPAATP
jgi:hypothetical protein